jgi:hypothetical protein
MHDPDSNPYAPPASESLAESPTFDGEPREYRIEKNVMILPPPYILPEVCFLTGARQGLQRCEIPLKVMPKWWNYVMPVIMFSVQMIVMFSSIAIQKLQLRTPSWIAPQLVGVSIAFITPAVIITGFMFVARKITLTGFRENSDAVFIRRRRSIARVLLFDFLLVGILLLTWLTLGASTPLVIITLISSFFIVILTLATWQRNRKPWSRIGALQQADGSLAVHGLDPSFLAVCRLGLVEPTHLLP